MREGRISIRSFSEACGRDAMRVINAYIEGWPYVRRVDAALMRHWRTLPAYQPRNMRLAYRSDVARAFLHGQEQDDKRFMIHLLALKPGAVEEGVRLLADAERRARARGMTSLIGPNWRALVFYAGFVLGQEPYHPHWAAEATEAYVRAGFRIGHQGVLLFRDLSKPVSIEPAPAPYEVRPIERKPEYGAVPFACAAFLGDQQVAHCYARLYPELKRPAGGFVGQLGHVGTEEGHRGKGLARVLCRLCLRRLRELGAAEALINTGLENFPALRVYERVGFVRRYNMNQWSKPLMEERR
jgi:GNAT superfamily N-acetyltransferase